MIMIMVSMINMIIISMKTTDNVSFYIFKKWWGMPIALTHPHEQLLSDIGQLKDKAS